jgi:hypothetical protein
MMNRMLKTHLLCSRVLTQCPGCGCENDGAVKYRSRVSLEPQLCLHFAAAVDHALGPGGELLDDLQPPARRPIVVRGQRHGSRIAPDRIAHANTHTMWANGKLDGDLIATAASVADRVRDKLACDKKRVRLGCASHVGSVEDADEQTPRRRYRARLRSQRGGSLTKCTDPSHLTKATRDRQRSIRSAPRGASPGERSDSSATATEAHRAADVCHTSAGQHLSEAVFSGFERTNDDFIRFDARPRSGC